MQAQEAGEGSRVDLGLADDALRQRDERRAVLGAVPGHEHPVFIIEEIQDRARSFDGARRALGHEPVEAGVGLVLQDRVAKSLEHVEDAPIFWHNCPYVDFQNR